MCCMKYYDTIFATGRYIAFLFEYSYFEDMFLWIMTLCYHTGWSACDSTSVKVRFQSKNFHLLLIACEAFIIDQISLVLSYCSVIIKIWFIISSTLYTACWAFLSLILVYYSNLSAKSEQAWVPGFPRSYVLVNSRCVFQVDCLGHLTSLKVCNKIWIVL